jgi:hypothetical protein
MLRIAGRTMRPPTVALSFETLAAQAPQGEGIKPVVRQQN